MAPFSNALLSFIPGAQPGRTPLQHTTPQLNHSPFVQTERRCVRFFLLHNSSMAGAPSSVDLNDLLRRLALRLRLLLLGDVHKEARRESVEQDPVRQDSRVVC